MIVKYSDKFDSIFYAVLYSNITDSVLIPKNYKNNQKSIFDNEDFLDMDNVNFNDILEKHNEKYGEINWFKANNENFIEFKEKIELAIRYYNSHKYKVIIDYIKVVIKYGLKVIENNPEMMEIQAFNKVVHEVRSEIYSSFSSNMRFFPNEY